MKEVIRNFSEFAHDRALPAAGRGDGKLKD
jgi:hypothetical protein